MRINVRSVDFYRLLMKTRFPFCYGIASMTELPHLFVRATVDIDGKKSIGMSADGLPPKWFTKNPDTTFEEDLPEMLRVIRHAADAATHIGPRHSFFDWWRCHYDQQQRWATNENIPPLLSSFGASLLERAVLDAFCRAAEQPLHTVLVRNLLELDVGQLRGQLAGVIPADFLATKPPDELIVRHTIGLTDPLTDGEIKASDRIHDGLPHSLEAIIRQYGITHFKIKMTGDLQHDTTRLRQLAQIIGNNAGAAARFTLDGNENFHRVADFQEHWNTYQADPVLRAFFASSLLFVEQPIHRDFALSQQLRLDVGWTNPPSMIIDESDAELASFPTAVSCGYAGTSHKNCKGVMKGILNAADIYHRQQNQRTALLSAEDLANVGPIALLQDLAVAACVGVDHVERNGHHYFCGLSMLPQSEQQKALRNHPDLYELAKPGFPTLKIRNGRLQMGSVNAAPFGVSEHPDVSLFERWKF
ncbi:MAG: enolase C-terminal domain-like protein [Fuerstiella sp.]